MSVALLSARCYTTMLLRSSLIARQVQAPRVRVINAAASFSSAPPASNAKVNPGTTLEDALSDRTQPSRRFRRKGGGNNKHRANNNKHKQQAAARTGPIRLSKRMSELDLCSRREADRLIEAGRVLVNGVAVEPIMGQKVDPTEMKIAIIRKGANISNIDGQQKDIADNKNNIIRPLEFDWQRMRGDTIVLNKPPGYVSGQPEKDALGGKGRQHVPVVRLLTRANLYIRDGIDEDKELQETLSNGNYLHFSRRFGDGSGSNKMHKGQRRRQSDTSAEDQGWNRDNSDESYPPRPDATLTNYVPAGRLDLDSSGLLIFTKNGVMAKKLISPKGLIEKEYSVKVEPAQSLTRVEVEMGMTSLPKPTRDLSPLLRGGTTLFGEHRALRPVVEAEWMDDDIDAKGGSDNIGSKTIGGTLRIVLKEGMKRHIRRACRELLGMHVQSLSRTRIGNIQLDVPEGRWRPLREEEARSIFFADKGR